MKVARIGECMVELAQVDGGLFRRGFGGDTLNTALYLSRLGVDTAYVTALGDDALSEAMLAARATSGLYVSIDIGTLTRLEIARITGITRDSSSSALTGSA